MDAATLASAIARFAETRRSSDVGGVVAEAAERQLAEEVQPPRPALFDSGQQTLPGMPRSVDEHSERRREQRLNTTNHSETRRLARSDAVASWRDLSVIVFGATALMAFAFFALPSIFAVLVAVGVVVATLIVIKRILFDERQHATREV